MVSVVYWQPTAGLWLKQISLIGWQPPGAVLHSSHEPGELSQCFKHADSTTTVILVLLLLHDAIQTRL